jgi:hypothetical protein
MTCMSAVEFLNLNVAELLTQFCCLVPAGGLVGYLLLYTFTLHFGWQHSNSEFMFWYRFWILTMSLFCIHLIDFTWRVAVGNERIMDRHLSQFSRCEVGEVWILCAGIRMLECSGLSVVFRV